jgi:lycopene cyclase domain-containing protein
VRHLTYLGVLAVCLIGTAPLEIFLRARVYRRWRRTVLAIVPAVVVFTAWDVAAIQARWWHFDQHFMSGVLLPGRLPVEELLFFFVVPLCAILTFEAVRRLRPDWSAGDERAGDERAGDERADRGAG